MEIHPYPEIEVLLGLAADHRGEVEDDAGIGVDQRLCGARLAEVPDALVDARVVGQRREPGADVADDDAFDLVLGPVGAGDRAAFEQRRDQTAAEKPVPSGDQDLHVSSSDAGG